EGVPQEGKEIVCRRNAATHEFCIVMRLCVRNHKMMPVTGIDPIRQLIVVAIGVIQKPPMLKQQPTSMLTGRVTTIPAQWCLSHCFLDGEHRTFDVFGFL